MQDTWAEAFVDKQMGRAWLAFRVDLADRMAVGLQDGWMEPMEITAPTGETVTVTVEDDRVLVMGAEEIIAKANVDEAAYAVFQLLHDEWCVVHPTFLQSDLVAVPQDEQVPPAGGVPVLGRAESGDQLHAWVISALQDGLSVPLKVAPNGDIPWRNRSGVVVVSVRNQYWVEIWTVLARQVSFKKARNLMPQLSKRYAGVRFHLQQDNLIMSRLVDASPFVPEHLVDALRLQLALSDRLDWVGERVLRKRAKERQDRVIDPSLAVLLPVAADLPMGSLCRAVRNAAGSSRTLARWRLVARQEWARARRLPRGESDPADVSRRLRTAWMRLARAIDLALEATQQAGEAA